MATDISVLVAEKGLDNLEAPIKMVTSLHTPVPFSPVLEDAYVPDSDKVIKEVKSIMSE